MQSTENKSSENNMIRRENLDYLRVFATFAIIIIHVSAQNWYTTDVNGVAWQTFNTIDSLVRWGVPAFVMISGALFLDRDIPVKKMYSKYILRLAIAFAFWSVVYAVFTDGSLLKKVSAAVRGHYHMWFILMIIGLYMCVPFLKLIIKTDILMKYFLVLSFVFAFLLPELITLSKDFGNSYIIKSADIVNGILNDMNIQFVLGYTGFFILGYYLEKTSLNKHHRIVVYILGLAGVVFTNAADLIVALKTQTACGNYYGYINVNVLFEVVAVFTFFKYRKYENAKLNATMKKLSGLCFGVYLIHVLILELLDKWLGLNTLSFNPFLAVIAISVIVSLAAFILSALLNRIPVVKKYIV